jgi:hypothetical protein
MLRPGFRKDAIFQMDHAIIQFAHVLAAVLHKFAQLPELIVGKRSATVHAKQLRLQLEDAIVSEQHARMAEDTGESGPTCSGEVDPVKAHCH